DFARGVQEAAVRVEVEGARRRLRRGVPAGGETAVRRADTETGDAVVAPVGDVQGAAAGVQADLRTGVVPPEVRRQGRDRLERLQCARLGVPLVGRDAAALLVDDIGD